MESDKVSTGRLVLASGSRTRRRLLEAAGIPCIWEDSGVDEEALKQRLENRHPTYVCMALAQAKAGAVGKHRKDGQNMILGVDQVLDFQGKVLSKVRDTEQAWRQLTLLRGREHKLHVCAVLLKGDEEIWRCTETASLTMRHFSDDFLRHYLQRMDNDVLETVGSYRLEGEGIQLFEYVRGDYFVVLGLPMVSLLKVLREQGIVPQ